MYTILINTDNTLYGSQKERIIKGSKLVDKLVFIVDPIYKDIDMTDASVVMEYVLPISREYKTENLILSDERYNDYYLQYELPFNTNLTKENGSVELQLTFIKTELDENGKGIQRVRKTSSTVIEITPISAWADIVPDSALSALDQRIIKLDALARELADCAEVIDENQVDNLVYDADNDTLQLSVKGVSIGDKISIKDMLDEGSPIVDLNSNSENKTNMNIEF